MHQLSCLVQICSAITRRMIPVCYYTPFMLMLALAYNYRIIIKSPDTDVLLLCIHFFPSMSNTKELCFKAETVTRTKDGRRYLSVHDVCHIQGPLVCKLFPAVHALTGCDTTSSFFRIGKKTTNSLT